MKVAHLLVMLDVQIHRYSAYHYSNKDRSFP
uniref:Uncharacterized protein n=1 Tax=mine drainage metagenome TaxID=410659 RepID=E6Q8W1_9ZZZZ